MLTNEAAECASRSLKSAIKSPLTTQQADVFHSEVSYTEHWITAARATDEMAPLFAY